MTGDNIESIKLKVVEFVMDHSRDSIRLPEIHFNMKQTTQMGRLKRRYGELAGVPFSSLRFIFEGARFNDDETPKTLEMEQEEVIEVSWEIGYGNDIKVAKAITETTANKVDQKTCEDRSQTAEEEVGSKIPSPVVDPKEICWFCHTSRTDLPVLYKCAGCNPKVVF